MRHYKERSALMVPPTFYSLCGELILILVGRIWMDDLDLRVNWRKNFKCLQIEDN